MSSYRRDWRLWGGFVLLVGLWMVFIGRLAQLTLMGDSHDLREKGRAIQECRQPLPARRGEIRDRYGLPLVTDATSWSLWGNPNQLCDLERVARVVGPAMVTSPASVADSWRMLGPRYQCLATSIERPQLLQPGIAARFGLEVVETHHRLYTHGSLGAHLLGFLGQDGNGLEGIELGWDRALRGDPGWLVRLRDGAGGYYTAAGGPRRGPIPGRDIVLTLDCRAQEAAEMVLARTVEKWEAKGGSIVVVEPTTGDILAMANQPTYDPRAPGEYPPDYRRNRAVTDMHEPGSTLKLVLAALLLERELVGPEEMVFAENGTFSLGGAKLHDSHDYGWLSFRRAFEVSSNISFFKLSSLVSSEEFYRTLRDFGFGTPTGIRLPGEAAGIMRPPRAWSSRSKGTMAIGQEIAVTPLQLVMAYAAVANEGVLMVPRLVKSILGPDGEEDHSFPPFCRRRIVSQRTAAELTSFLEGAVQNGTGRGAELPGVRVAGKTGTAQKADPEHGGYKAKAYTASFVGFFPAEKPRYAALVVVDEPQGEHYGGTVAAPAFRDLAQRLLAQPSGEPSRRSQTERFEDFRRHHAPLPTPELLQAGMVDHTEVARRLEGAARVLQGLRNSTAGEDRSSSDAAGHFSSPAPLPQSTIGEVPSLIGLSLREARRELGRAGLRGEWSGTGLVVEQHPASGRTLPPGGVVRIHASLDVAS